MEKSQKSTYALSVVLTTVYELQICRSTKYFNFRRYFNFDLGALFALPLGNFPTGDKQPYKNLAERLLNMNKTTTKQASRVT